MSRDTNVTYTCDVCKNREPETRKGFYPIEWHRVTVHSIERNMNVIENRELCMQCSRDLRAFLYPAEEDKNA